MNARGLLISFEDYFAPQFMHGVSVLYDSVWDTMVDHNTAIRTMLYDGVATSHIQPADNNRREKLVEKAVEVLEQKRIKFSRRINDGVDVLVAHYCFNVSVEGSRFNSSILKNVSSALKRMELMMSPDAYVLVNPHMDKIVHVPKKTSALILVHIVKKMSDVPHLSDTAKKIIIAMEDFMTDSQIEETIDVMTKHTPGKTLDPRIIEVGAKKIYDELQKMDRMLPAQLLYHKIREN